MAERTRKSHDASPESSRGKGDILEAIVEEMHSVAGLTVERNVFLPSVGDPGREREIDVLITGNMAGYLVRIPIECKNVTSPIEVGQIDEFDGKLKDVGLPSTLGVFITASRFRSGALSRAKALGIRTLQFRNLKNELADAVTTAIHSLVFLLLTLTQIQITNDIADVAPTGEMLFFRGENGELKGGVPDLVWSQWRKGDLDDSLGEHSVDIDLPDDWNQLVGDQLAKVECISVMYEVTAHVVDFQGSLEMHHLVDQESGELNRFHLEAIFDRPEGKYPVSSYSKEEELIMALRNRAPLQITIGRQRLPRIRFLSMYWPPSKKAMKFLKSRFIEAVNNNEKFDLSKIAIEEIEGTDLSAIWEPMIKDHLMRADPEDQDYMG